MIKELEQAGLISIMNLSNIALNTDFDLHLSIPVDYRYT